MKRHRVVFFHGREGSPAGTKAVHLRSRWDAATPMLPTDSLDEAIPGAIAAIERARPEVLVGSSFGGSLIMELTHRGLWTGPCLLLAPSPRLLSPGRRRLLEPTTIIHGTRDAIASPETTRLWAENAVVPCRHVLVEDDHPLRSVVDSGVLDRELELLLGATGRNCVEEHHRQ